VACPPVPGPMSYAACCPSCPPPGRGVLSSTPLPKPLPQERLAPVSQLLIGPMDLTEERHKILVARSLGVLEVGAARVSALEGMIEDTDKIVLLILGTISAFPRFRGLVVSFAPGYYPRQDERAVESMTASRMTAVVPARFGAIPTVGAPRERCRRGVGLDLVAIDGQHVLFDAARHFPEDMPVRRCWRPSVFCVMADPLSSDGPEG
jgi:hypothetical protein